MKNSEKEEIKKLIKHGFDLELISFELDIPIEEVKQCELELRELPKVKSEKSLHNNNQRRKIVRKQKHTKIQQMREKYKKLYFTDIKMIFQKI